MRALAAFFAASVLAARAGLVEDWNAAFERSVMVETHPPALAARNLALLHAAVHDAVFAGTGSFPPLLAGPAAAGAEGNPEARAAAAAHRVCSVLFPSRQADFDALLLRQFPAGPGDGGSAGRAVAESALEARRDDGAATTVHYFPREGEGQWRRTTHNRPPELPHWPAVRPFCLDRADRFRPPPPPGPGSPEGLAALDEVRRLGGRGSAARTPEQETIARFWSDFSYTCTPPGHWNRIARGLAADRRLDLAETARLFAVLNLALADAGIAAWDCKYHYNHWRPVTALAAREPGWEPLLATPSHPEYVSGHSAFSAAAAAVLAARFGDDAAFRETSDALPGVTRSFASFSAAVEEIGRSRVFGGIHFTYSDRQGRELGRQVAAKVLRLHPIRVP